MRHLGRSSRMRGLALLVGLAGAGVSSSAFAEKGELPVAVLTIQTLDAFENADSFTGALRKAIDAAPGWATADTGKNYALQVLVISLDCADPPDAACEEKIAEEVKADRFLWGRMQKEGDDVTGDLHLWTKGAGSRATNFRYSANVKDAADETLVAVAAKHFAELSGPPPGATVKVRAGNHDGIVMVDGKEAGKLVAGQATVQVPEGTHSLSVVVEGHLPASMQVELKPRETKHVALTPTPEGQGPDVQKILGFTAMGLGVASAGVAVAAMVTVNSINGEFEAVKSGSIGGIAIVDGTGSGGAIDGCDSGPAGDYPNLAGSETQLTYYRDQCDTGHTMQLLQIVFWPLAGALAGAGAVMVATSDWGGEPTDEEAARYRIDPRFGPGGADVTFTMQF